MVAQVPTAGPVPPPTAEEKAAVETAAQRPAASVLSRSTHIQNILADFRLRDEFAKRNGMTTDEADKYLQDELNRAIDEERGPANTLGEIDEQAQSEINAHENWAKSQTEAYDQAAQCMKDAGL